MKGKSGKMKRKKITSRQKEIILLLAQNPINKPITISAIAKELNLSSRTVLRDMASVENWLDENDFDFIKKPGVGLILNETLENQKLIKELLEEEKIDKEYSKEERKLFILSELLSSNEPIKSLYFTKSLKISEGTLNNDLIGAGEWISKFDLEIAKKPGSGIYIEGKEKNFRKAYINLIYDSCNEKEILEMIRSIKKNLGTTKTIEISSENRLLNLIDKSIIRQTETTLTREISELNLKLADSAYIGLVVHLSLALQRIKNGEKITMDPKFLSQLSDSEEFKIAKKISEGIEKDFKIEMPIDEVGYITMHIRGAKLRFNSSENVIDIDQIELMNISKKIIDLAEEEFKVSLKNDDRLLKDLTNHLGPAISRLNMGMLIRNPLLEDIKRDYSYFYKGVEKICVVLKDIVDTDLIPESEIAYITMHIASAVERNLMINTDINVVVSCPTGIGTSRFLVTKIQKNFHNIKVIDTISAININEENLKKQNVDLIISTVNLSTDLDYICVTPFMGEEDKALIQQTVRYIAKNKMKNMALENEIKTIDTISNEEDILELMNIGRDILEFIKDIRFIKDYKCDQLEELIKICSNEFSKNDEQSTEIAKSLNRRVNISTPYIEDIGMILLHSSCESIEEIKLAIIRLDNKIFINNEETSQHGLLMLIPSDAKPYFRQILSEISSNLIEDEMFVTAIKKSSQDEVKKMIEKIVLDFYTKKLLTVTNKIDKNKR